MKNILLISSALAAATTAAFYLVKKRKAQKLLPVAGNGSTKSRHRVNVFSYHKNRSNHNEF